MLFVDHQFEPLLFGADPIAQVYMFTMIALHVVMHLSTRGCHFLLAAMRYIIQLCLSHQLREISQSNHAFVEGLPADPDSIIAKFCLDSKETIYAVCLNAKCHAIYAPVFSSNSPLPSYPKTCTYREFDSDLECGTAILERRKVGDVFILVPIKRFISFSFKDYISNLLSRPGFEKMMDNPKQSLVMRQLIFWLWNSLDTHTEQSNDPPNT